MRALRKKPLLVDYSGEFVVHLTLNGMEVLYEIAETVRELSPEALYQNYSGLALSFTNRDQRLATEGKIGAAEMKKRFRLEHGQNLAGVNASKALGAVYGTDRERLTHAGRRYTSGALAFDVLRARGNMPSPPYVSGFYFEDPTGSSLAILFAVDDRGGVSNPFPVVVRSGAGGLSDAVKQFAADHAIQVNMADVALFHRDDVLSAVSEFTAYPSPQEWHGVPHRTLELGVLMALTAGVALLGGAAILKTFQLRSLASEEAGIRAEIQAVQAQNQARIAQGLISYARLTSLDDPWIFESVERAWKPDGKVSLKADPASVVITSQIAGERPKAVPIERRYFRAGQDARAVYDALTASAPDGMRRDSVSVTGDFSGFAIQYQSAPGGNGHGPALGN